MSAGGDHDAEIGEREFVVCQTSRLVAEHHGDLTQGRGVAEGGDGVARGNDGEVFARTGGGGGDERDVGERLGGVGAPRGVAKEPIGVDGELARLVREWREGARGRRGDGTVVGV